MGYSLNPYSPLQLQDSTILFEEPGELVPTGLSIKGTTEAGPFQIPLFQTRYSADSGRLGWEDLYFPADFAPIEYWARNCDCLGYGSGKMVRMHCLLYELKKLSSDAIKLVQFLDELNKTTGANNSSVLDLTTTEIELVPAAAETGHFVSYVNSHERELSVHFSRWIGSEAVNKEERAHVLVDQAIFRPTPQRRLNKAKRHPWEHFNLSHALWEDFNRIGFDSAASIFTPKGEQQLLRFFAWTKLALMTNREARAARVALLQKEHTRSDDIGAIAASLKTAELYSSNTSLSQIKKYLPGLLTEAFPQSSD